MPSYVPADFIDPQIAELEQLDEAAFMAAVLAIVPVPDEDDPCWDDDRFDAEFGNAARLIAAADVIGSRGWVGAIVPLLERAPLGDPAGQVQGIRHGPERAMSDDLPAFAALLEPLVSHERPGTRWWAVQELGVLRQATSRAVLQVALDDPVAAVRDEARASLTMFD